MANQDEVLGRDRVLYRGASNSDTEYMNRNQGYYGDPWRGLGPGTTLRGPYTGYGPRGYHRSDERIKDEVCNLLTQNGEIDASDIQVSVHDGEVTLQGTVDRRWTKRAAEALADSVYGVTDVHNELRIQRPGQTGQPAQANNSAPVQNANANVPPGWRDQGELGTLHAPTVAAATNTTKPDQVAPASTAEGEIARATGRIVGEPTVQPANPPVGQVRKGMQVIGSDGEPVGKVKLVERDDFQVDRRFAADVYVPYNAIQSISGDTVALDIPADKVKYKEWFEPVLIPPAEKSKE